MAVTYRPMYIPLPQPRIRSIVMWASVEFECCELFADLCWCVGEWLKNVPSQMPGVWFR